MEKADKTFEQQWSQAMEGAEVTPPSHVWVGIDGQLAHAQAANYKKQADFYRWAAAACLFLVSLVGGLYWMGGGETADDLVVHTEGQMPTSPQIKDNQASVMTLADDEKNEDTNTSMQSSSASISLDHVSHAGNTALIESPATPTIAPRTGEWEVKSLHRSGVEEVQLMAISSKKTTMPSLVSPWQANQLYGVARTWETIDEDKMESPMWAGVSFSAGSFDPGFSGGGQRSMVVMSQSSSFSAESSARVKSQSVADPVYASGQSVAGGLDLGRKFTKKIMLSGGLHYSAFNTGSASSQTVTDELDNSFALTNATTDTNLEEALSDGQLRFDGQQVQLANEYQYITIPVKAGYILLDKQFNITINTGVSSNFLVDSQLVSSSTSRTLSNELNTSQAYQSVYFNFLTSVSFGYVFKQHYQFLLEPNYNQALTNFTNTSYEDQAKPKNIGVAIGFRYNF
ncbi:hypothetical protein N7E81_13125 [Reichenbachiella carrageenanivorans]|uniref:Outer membrane protein beta-barrel domain-containing protein n=1 Tax=Reichenbachiella carrageenanivorans TaxID=2979869 RepID=A0ABY6CZP6_9BACT|nr:hypothetical protein [Reichenbachiella carrageenanivorans]UXX78298.1 hypothetical protein N7E81_13125 [Reichenbachiella carrageenanivorans]